MNDILEILHPKVEAHGVAVENRSNPVLTREKQRRDSPLERDVHSLQLGGKAVLRIS